MMNYESLIRRAWAMTWRHRFLWILGLFGGGAVGVSGGAGGRAQGMQWRAGTEDLERVAPEVARAAAEVGRWVSANAGLLVAGAVVVLIIGLVLLVVSIIAQGGMAEATVDLAAGRPVSLGQAWGAGVRLFWRYLGLYLVLVGIAIVAAAVIGAVAALALAPLMAGAQAARGFAALAIIVAIPLAIAGIAVAIAVNIIVAYAQRAIYAEDAGPVGALQAGWRVLRAHPGESALTWLINLGLAIGAGIAVVAAAVVVMALLAGGGAALWRLAGLTAPTIAYAVLVLLALLAAGALAAGVINTFFWHYWTLAYLRLSGRGETVDNQGFA